MGIPLNSSFSRGSAQPLDDSVIVANIAARDAINSAYRYEGMTVYSLADELNFQLVGGIANGDWTLFGGSGGGGMNIIANQTIASGATIALNALSIQQMLRVSGAAGPQTTSTAPFNTPPDDGTIIVLLGTSAVNILKIPYVDAVEGCLLKGDMFLGLNDTLSLIYDLTAQRYIEMTRNI